METATAGGYGVRRGPNIMVVSFAVEGRPKSSPPLSF